MNVLHWLLALVAHGKGPEPAQPPLATMGRGFLEIALEIPLGDRETARWFAAEIATRRVCACRFQRIVCKARAAAECGLPQIAQAYLHGELRRLAARCGRPCPIPVPSQLNKANYRFD